MHIFPLLPWVNVILSHFKQLLLNSTLIYESRKFNKGLGVLSDVVRGLIVSLGNPLDFHYKIKKIFLKIFLHWLKH